MFLVWKRRCANVRAGTQAPPLRFRLGGLRVNGYFVCVGLRGKILRRWVGAVPVCPPVSPCRGAFVVHPPRMMRVFLLWKRRYADVRASTQAPPLRFRLGGLRVGGLVSFGWIAREWLFCLCGIAWKNITERGRGGACVPARVAHQGRICCHLCAGVALSFDVEKVVFIFICIFASNKNVNQEQSWNV